MLALAQAAKGLTVICWQGAAAAGRVMGWAGVCVWGGGAAVPGGQAGKCSKLRVLWLLGTAAAARARDLMDCWHWDQPPMGHTMSETLWMRARLGCECSSQSHGFGDCWHSQWDLPPKA